jgi:hypothetical protein
VLAQIQCAAQVQRIHLANVKDRVVILCQFRNILYIPPSPTTLARTHNVSRQANLSRRARARIVPFARRNVRRR